MIEHLGTANLVFLSLWFFLGLSLVALRRPLLMLLRDLHPQQATSLLLVAVFLPISISVATTVLLYLPLVNDFLIGYHCHDGVCSNHHPVGILPQAGPASLVLTVLALVTISRKSWRSTTASRRCKDSVRLFSRDRGDFLEVPDQQLLAFTVGLLTPRVVLSSGLLAHCDEKERDIVLRHERGHVLHRDNLRLLLAKMVSLPMPGAAPFRGELRLGIEKHCDLIASKVHSRADVARCIVKLAEASCAAAPHTSGFVDEAVEQRVMALLNPAPRPPSPFITASTVAVMLTLAGLSINPLHHQIELLLFWLSE